MLFFIRRTGINNYSKFFIFKFKRTDARLHCYCHNHSFLENWKREKLHSKLKNVRSDYILSSKTMHKPSNASSLFEPGNLENQPGFEQQHFRALICLFHLTYPLSPVNGSIVTKMLG